MTPDRPSRIRALAFVLAIAVLAGCGRGPESARQELAELDVEFTKERFVEAVDNSDVVVARLFLEAGMRVDPAASKEAGGGAEAALQLAARQGHLDLVRLLLRHGADVDRVGPRGRTALIEAAHWGFLDVVRELLAAGADARTADDSGSTALLAASGGGHLAVVEELLATGPGAEELARALRVSVIRERLPVIERLLAAGADIEWRDDSGRTALLVGADHGRPESVRTLLDHGADVHAVDSRGATALMLVAEGVVVHAVDPLIDLLVERGADVGRRDRAGRTAYEIARGHEKQDHLAIRKTLYALRRHGGAPDER